MDHHALQRPQGKGSDGAALLGVANAGSTTYDSDVVPRERHYTDHALTYATFIRSRPIEVRERKQRFLLGCGLKGLMWLGAEDMAQALHSGAAPVVTKVNADRLNWVRALVRSKHDRGRVTPSEAEWWQNSRQFLTAETAMKIACEADAVAPPIHR